MTTQKLPKIIENNRKKLLDTILEVGPSYKEVSIATGYWDIEGMKLVLDSLKSYEKIRVLIGREPLLKRDNLNNTDTPELDYPDNDFFSDLERIEPSPELTQVVVEMKKMIDEGRMQVRVYRKSFLHAKCYIFGGHSSDNAVGIIGSSNFTRNGMTTNAELNALEDDSRVVTYEPKSETQEVGHLFWFDSMWNDELTEDWTGQFVELVRTSKHGDLLHSPRDMYLRSLYEIYKDEINQDKEDIIRPQAKQLFEFQEKNVRNLKRILDNYGVAMLADSVGLGKTISAIGVIKQYKNQRIVVIAPKSLNGQWRAELDQEGLLNVDVVSLQNKQEILDQQDRDKYIGVGLFIIDESHNLRTHNGSRYETVSDWIAGSRNEEAHVLLCTATPINNSLTDLTSQILLGARGDQDIFTLAVKSYEGQVVTRSFYEAIDNIRLRIGQEISRGGENLQEIYNEARITIEPIIRNFVVRNTRQSIGKITLPDGTIKEFPKATVNNIAYETFSQGIEMSDDLAVIQEFSTYQLAETMDILIHPLRQIREMTPKDNVPSDPSLIYNIYQLILSLSFVPYRWRMYDFSLYGKTKEELKTIKLGNTEKQKVNMQLSIYGIMRTLFLKRLESSSSALEKSLKRYLSKLEIFEQILRDENIIINLSDIDDIVDEYSEDDGEQVIYDEKNLIDLARKQPQEVDDNYNKEVMFEDIAMEKALINEIIILAQKHKEQDPKIKELKDKLLSYHNENPQKKVLIFSFFADTINYIENEFSADPELKSIFENSAFVSGRDRKNAIYCAKRFAPVAKESPEVAEKDGELTYLFATDVLSEGQNLQDCGAIINYDLHWNPVRMVQRNGRINRLGSSHSLVTVENFVPDEDLENFLGLMQRLQNKINLIKHAIGTESSLFGEEIDPRSYTDLYSNDSETATESYDSFESSLDAFSDDMFLRDLISFYETATNEEIRHMERIPFQSWGIVQGGLDKPNDSVIMSSMTYDDGSHKYVFFGNDSEASGIDMIQKTIALKMIRSNIQEKQLNTISLDVKKHESAMLRRGPQIAIDTQVNATLTPTKDLVLNLASELGWSAENIDRLRATLITRNVNLGRKVSRKVRAINVAHKENIPTEEYFNELKELLTDSLEKPTVSSTEFLFGYTDQYDK